MRRHFGLCIFLLAAAACSTRPTQPAPNGARPVTTADPAEEGVDANAEGGGKSGERPPGPRLPSGPVCDSNADCGEGQVCEGLGCDALQGRCVTRERACTRDLAQYCGCDGQTFSGSGSCPGARYAYRGACTPNKEDGEPCSDGRQCRSGQCLGEGLEGCSKAAQGVCGTADCPKDLVSYCSCNNTPMQAPGSCPNQQFAYRGPCEAD